MLRLFAVFLSCCLAELALPVSGQHAAEIITRRFPAAQFGSWATVYESTSPAAHHYTLRPFVAGRWLWPTTVRLTIANDGRVRHYLSEPLLRIDSLRGFDAAVPTAGRTAITDGYLRGKVGATLLSAVTTRNALSVWYLADSANHFVKPGWLLTWGAADSRIGAWEVLLDAATGEEVRPARDLFSYEARGRREVRSAKCEVPNARPVTSNIELHTSDLTLRTSHLAPRNAPPDTFALAYVFRPDPLSTAQRPYGRPFIDSLDTDRPALNQQRVLDTLRLTFATDSFRLRNPWFEMAEFDPPVRPVVAAHAASGLQFTRAEAGFQQVNALYHLTRCRAYITSLGFGSLLDRRLRVDVSGMSGLDQSRFSPLDTTLSFGEGGVDDAEDADVLTHEYCHALAFAAAPNTNIGLERRTLDEANADYLAAVYSARLLGSNAYGAEQVYNWDGHNEFWAGRWVISPKIYPRDLVGSIYLDADIWSSTLWQIRQAVPDTVADRLFFQHLYSYAPNLTMRDAARLFMLADTLIYGAAHADTIYHYFYERHLLGNHSVVGVSDPSATTNNVQVWATDAFARGEAARFRAPFDTELWLVNATGAVVWRGRAAADSEVPIPARNLPPGLYVLRYAAGRSVKLLRR